MAQKDPEEPLDYEDEEYEDDEYQEEGDDADGGSSWKWIGLAAGGVLIVCIGLAALLWFARDTLLAPIAGMIATETPTATVTPQPTATFTITPSATATVEPSATPTLTATPLLLPPPEVMAIVEGPPTLNEQFDDNARNWTGLAPGAEYTIQQGMIVFKSGNPGQSSIVYCVTDCGPYEDRYFYQAEVVDERGSTAAHGIAFGLDQQRNTYYLFAVKPASSEYGLFKQVGTQLTPLVDWTTSAAVLPAPQPNVLGVRFLENKIDLFVNGTWVNEKVDKNNPYTSGRIGLYVEQDGVRLLGNQAKVFLLMEVTPEPPGTRPTQAPVPVQPTAAQPPAGQPTQAAPAIPTTPAPAPTAARFTPTPTTAGSCGPTIPEGKWALVITRTGTSNKPPEVKINGTSYKLTQLNTVFYLDLNTNYTVQLGNKTFEFNYPECKIVYRKIQG